MIDHDSVTIVTGSNDLVLSTLLEKRRGGVLSSISRPGVEGGGGEAVSSGFGLRAARDRPWP